MLSVLGVFFLGLIFLFFQATGIYGGDSGDLVTAAYLGGVPHPPGYPLYTLLGFLLTKIPISTVAWRIGLLSSIPHALTATFVFVLVWRLTKQVLPAIFSSLLLTGNYLFFLYSVTPEVFALFDLFLILLTYLIYQKRYFWASIVFGLALSHHHVILFFVPSLLYWIIASKKFTKKFILHSSFFILLGLLPYLYIPLAARGSAIVNWDRPVDLKNFIRLVSRADYGTFVSSGFYGSEISTRLIQLKMYVTFLLTDFTWIGIVLFVLGAVFLFRRQKIFAVGLLLAIFFLGPLFYFYASFPLVNRFTVGTYERFLLPSYLFLSIFMGAGFVKLLEFPKPVFRLALAVVLFVYPLSIGAMTIWRFWEIRSDQTATKLGRDVLASVPQNGILLLQRDTPLFTTQYVRYVLRERSDVKLIHSSRLPFPDYTVVLQKVFPELSMPIIQGNSKKFPIASITRLPAAAGWVWVPNGLVFLLTQESEVPSVATLIQRNEGLWSTFQNPATGILGSYNHLMLSDIADVYATGRIELGKTLVRAGSLENAKKQFEEAIALDGDTQKSDSYVYLGLTELFLKNCKEALSAFEAAKRTRFTAEPNITLYQAHAQRECGNEQAAKELFDQFAKEQEERQTPLR